MRQRPGTEGYVVFTNKRILLACATAFPVAWFLPDKPILSWWSLLWLITGMIGGLICLFIFLIYDILMYEREQHKPVVLNEDSPEWENREQ